MILSWHRVLSWYLGQGLWLVLLLILGSGCARAAVPVLSPDSPAVIDLWPHLTWLQESSTALSIEQVMTRRATFGKPAVPRANFGPQPQPFWLYVPVRVADKDSGEWILSVEYPSLDHVDIFVTNDGVVRHSESLGRELPSTAGLPSVSAATQLALQPGLHYDVYLRIATKSAGVVPLKLYRPNAFYAQEARTQVLQGLLAGLGLCLLIYSLAQWASTAEAVFFYYSLTIFSTSLFLLAYFGLASQHLWPESLWLRVNAPPLLVMLALIGGSLFVDHVLQVRLVQPRISLALRGLAGLASLVLTLYVSGAIGYRWAQTIVTILGPWPMLLAIPTAYLRARSGERISAYILVGWGAYGLASITMAGLLRGWLPFNTWTEHAFQIGTTFEMVVWMHILGLHTQEIRRSAERVQREHDTLRSMAQTDPLTGMRNRRGLDEALQSVLPYVTPNYLAVVYLLDLDGFKPVNDTLGHEAGDDILIQVGQRLERLVRSSDVVARLGGDEFVVVTRHVGSADTAAVLADKLLAGFAQPFMTNGKLCRIGLTIGYALAPLDGTDGSELLKRADAAMYAGKQAGGGNVQRWQLNTDDALSGDSIGS